MARAVTPQRKWTFTIIAWLVALIIFFPILWTFLTAFKTEGDAILFPPAFFPPHWTLENFFEVQSRSNYFKHFFRLEITQLHQALKTTMICVTHDQVEAMTMADKIVVLNAGRIEQIGTPLELYNHPANLFVAGFIGSPKMNLIKPPEGMAPSAATIGVRPEDVEVSREKGQWPGTVTIAEHLGSDTFFHIDAKGLGRITVRTPGEFGLTSGEPVWLTPKPDRIHRFDKDGQALRA